MVTTKAQRKALKSVYDRIAYDHSANGDIAPYREWRRENVTYWFDVVMVSFSGMLLGIEPDGHTHS